MRRLALALAAALALALATSAGAAPEPPDPKRQTTWRLYLDAREAYDMKMARGDEVLFADFGVRSCIHASGPAWPIGERRPPALPVPIAGVAGPN